MNFLPGQIIVIFTLWWIFSLSLSEFPPSELLLLTGYFKRKATSARKIIDEHRLLRLTQLELEYGITEFFWKYKK